MVCPSSSYSSFLIKFQIISIFCLRCPLDLSGAWTTIFWTNELKIASVNSRIPTYLRIIAAKLSKPILLYLVGTAFQIIVPQAGHILDDNDFDFPASTRRIISFQPGLWKVTPKTPSSMKKVGLGKSLSAAYLSRIFFWKAICQGGFTRFMR